MGNKRIRDMTYPPSPSPCPLRTLRVCFARDLPERTGTFGRRVRFAVPYRKGGTPPLLSPNRGGKGLGDERGQDPHA